jgi:hypothetical protein
MSVGIYPSPIIGPQIWDQFQVQGVTWMGKIDVKGAFRSYRWDRKGPPGADGEVLTYRGKHTKSFRVTFYLWADFHFNTWPQFSLLFQYPGSKLGVVIPVSVYHPALAMVGITTVVCTDLGIPEKQSDDLMWAATVELREFIPPPPINVTSTPPGATSVSPPNIPGLAPSPAVLALEARKAALEAQAAALGGNSGLPP